MGRSCVCLMMEEFILKQGEPGHSQFDLDVALKPIKVGRYLRDHSKTTHCFFAGPEREGDSSKVTQLVRNRAITSSQTSRLPVCVF